MKILVLNPNSNEEVTQNIDESLEHISQSLDVVIRVENLEGSPHGIETQEDVEFVAEPVVSYFREQKDNYDAFVVACFSDPGLHAAREQVGKPVTGIAEAGLFTALSLGDRIGTISISGNSIARHHRYYRALGISQRIAGDVAIDSSVADLASADKTLDKMLLAGQRLKKDFGANALVLGCAGMPQYREPLERELGIPVVDPTQAATMMAISLAVMSAS